MTPVICSSISSKQSLLGLGWTITNLFALIGFITTAIMASVLYANAERNEQKYQNYNNQYNYNYNNNNNRNYYGYNNNYNDGGPEQEQSQMLQQMASLGSYSIAFAGIYTAAMTFTLAIFGGSRVIGYMSIGGDYVHPSRSGTANGKTDQKNFGIFIGALILVCNLFLVLAFLLNEFHVSGVDERRLEEFGSSFAIENIAKTIGSVFMALSVTYFVFIVLVFALKDGIFEEIEKVGRAGEKTVRIESYAAPQQPVYA
mmetsp:Transcript_16248/g.19842  ORF Transcript_16248/g.19842 Transcript_16248/m.19842 type:complete len:257 (+) Transcript_16248:103-873(+)